MAITQQVQRQVQRQVDQHVGSRVSPVVRWGLGHAMPRLAIRGSARNGDLHGMLIEATAAGGVPLDLIAAIRADGPLHRSKFAYVTASQPVVKEVLTSNDVRAGVDFAPDGGLMARVGTWAGRQAPVGPLTSPSLLVTEPPKHTRYRKLVTRVFSVKAVRDLRARTEQIAADLLDDLERSGRAASPVELVEAYCAQLPVTVIAEILGVPLADRHRVLDFGSAAAPSLDLGLDWRTFRRVESALGDFEAWLADHLEHVRRHPGDDLLSQLVAAREDGVGLSDDELRSTAGLVLAAGFETTVNLLGNAVALLSAHPDQLTGLLAGDPETATDRWTNAVDEVLRYDPPVLMTGRTAGADVELGGRQIPANSLVTTVLAAANRDPEVFDDPASFDVTRENASDHLSFSGGRHYCLGAALARMEGEVGLSRLFARYPDLAVLPGAPRRRTRILRGYAELPVRLGAPRAAAEGRDRPCVEVDVHVWETVVVGAGQAGLSASYHLVRRGVDHVVLDADDRPGGAWQHRPDSLTMRDVHGIAALPDDQGPATDPDLRANTAVPASFAAYEAQHHLPVRRPVRVLAVEPADDDLLRVRTTDGTGGGDLLTRTLVNATGTWTRPFVPAYPGAGLFAGTQLHSSDHPGPDWYRGRRVVVVGGGASAVQLLGEIAPVAAATLWVTRREPTWVARPLTEQDGRAAVARVEERVRRGLPPVSVVSVTGLRLREQEREAERLGAYVRRAMFASIEPDGVRWDDQSFEPVDAIVWATGFRPAISHLAPLRLRSEAGGIALDGTTAIADRRVQLVGYGPSASTIGANRAGRSAALAVVEVLDGSDATV